jgi:hypothetical protein
MASMKALPFFSGFYYLLRRRADIDYAPATTVINLAVASYGERQKLIAEVVGFD